MSLLKRLNEAVARSQSDLAGMTEVKDKVDCSNAKLTSLAGTPTHVQGSFNCSNNPSLTSLEGGPRKVDSFYNASNCGLTSLRGAPKKHDDDFTCFSCKLTTLEGAPESVDGAFDCSHNEKLGSLAHAPADVVDLVANDCGLTTLVGAPSRIRGNVDLRNNAGVKSLEGLPDYVGSLQLTHCRVQSLEHLPKTINGSLALSYNRMKRLSGTPAVVVNGAVKLDNNLLTSLEGVNKVFSSISGEVQLRHNNIKSHVLGLFFTGCTSVSMDNREVQDILNRYLPEGRAGLTKAQNELIEAELEEYAQV